MKHCPPERAVRVAQGLLESVQSYRFVWGDRIFKVGVNIGVVPIKTEGQAQALLSLADMACYAAKDRGRNRIHLYSEEDQDILLRRGDMNWLQRIQTAIANDHFFSVGSESRRCREMRIILNCCCVCRVMDDRSSLRTSSSRLQSTTT